MRQFGGPVFFLSFSQTTTTSRKKKKEKKKKFLSAPSERNSSRKMWRSPVVFLTPDEFAEKLDGQSQNGEEMKRRVSNKAETNFGSNVLNTATI